MGFAMNGNGVSRRNAKAKRRGGAAESFGCHARRRVTERSFLPLL